MDLNIFNQPDPSGKMTKESYLFKNHKKEYDYIVNYCENNNIFDIPFKEKVYMCLKGIDKHPTCRNPNCHKKVSFINSTLGYREYCSNKCISSDPNVKELKKSKSLEKFGTNTPAQSDLIKQKIIQTNKEKYGGNSPMSSEIVQEKSKKTLNKNWGVDNPNKSEILVKKRVESFRSNIDKYKESYRKTSFDRYGVYHPWINKEIHNKTVESAKKIRNETVRETINRMLPSDFILIDVCFDTGDAKILCNRGHEFMSTREFIYNRWRIKSEICNVCNPIKSQKSGAEISLYKFIQDIYEGEIVENKRDIISPFEIDFYLPELKIGFEYNGLWWHSSEYRKYDYHYLKQKKSYDVGIKLISIWEDDWVYRNDIIKSFIMSKLGKIKNKIYARNCEVITLDKKSSDLFLENNHLNGVCKSSIRICLKYKGEIVGTSTFIKKKEGWEMNRFCSKNYVSVVGGFTKMLQFFIRNYNPKFILTYSDNLISDGQLYNKNKFELLEDISPSYSLLISKERKHRLNYDGKSYPKIYNAGNKKWILKNNI